MLEDYSEHVPTIASTRSCTDEMLFMLGGLFFSHHGSEEVSLPAQTRNLCSQVSAGEAGRT